MNRKQLAELFGNDEPEERRPLDIDIEVELLQAARRDYNVHHKFEPGMIVRQKKGCSIYNHVSSNKIAIVMQVLAVSILDPREETGSPFYRQYVDMVIGERSDDGDLLFYHVDSRRFEPVPAEDLVPKKE